MTALHSQEARSAAPSPRPARRTPGRLAAVVTAHPLAAFLVWAGTVGQVPAVLAGRAMDGGRPLAGEVLIVVSTWVGLLLPAVAITRIVEGPAGVRALWRSAVRLQHPAAWYAAAVLVVPALATAVTVSALGPPDLPPSAVVTALLATLLVRLPLLLVSTNWAEEVAWSGFVQARLQARSGPVRAAALTGVLFALQHAALLSDGSPAGLVVLLVLLTALAVPFRLLTGWLFARTGSVFLVGLLHAAGNAVAIGGAAPGLLPRLYPGSGLPGTAHLLAFAVLGLVVLAGTRGRLVSPVPAGTRTARAPRRPPGPPRRR